METVGDSEYHAKLARAAATRWREQWCRCRSPVTWGRHKAWTQARRIRRL